MFKKNVGTSDRVFRIFFGLALLGFVGLYMKSWWGLIGIVPILTALVRFCPAYALFGASTCANPEPGQPISDGDTN